MWVEEAQQRSAQGLLAQGRAGCGGPRRTAPHPHPRPKEGVNARPRAHEAVTAVTLPMSDLNSAHGECQLGERPERRAPRICEDPKTRSLWFTCALCGELTPSLRKLLAGNRVTGRASATVSGASPGQARRPLLEQSPFPQLKCELL